MLKQTTLDGRIVNNNSYEIYQFARRYPERFAKYCKDEGVAYRGEFCEANTFFCLVELQKHFGFPIAIEMIDALAKYPVPKITRFRIEHPKEQTELFELLKPNGEEYKVPEESKLGEDTKITRVI